MAALTGSLWRSVGRFVDIKGIGRLEAVARQCLVGLNNDFWRYIWLTRCGGRLYKCKKRDYKKDVVVHFAKTVHRRMRLCTSLNRWYDNWQDAVDKRRRMLISEVRSMEASIQNCIYHMEENKRKLREISRVEQQAQAVLESIDAYGDARTGPMGTQRRRIAEQLDASNVNPWLHYYE